MKLLLTAIAFLIASVGFAQRQNVYFLKNNGKYVDVRDSADYIRIVREPDSASVLYNVFEYYLNGGKKLISKSSTIDPPEFEGQCLRFYKNGHKESTTNYKKGVMAGDEYEFYPNGKLYLVKQYPEDHQQYKDMSENFLVMNNLDSLGTVLVENGNGYYKGYDDNFKYVNEEGNVKNGKRDGTWKGDFKNITTTFIETYQDGILVTGTATYEDGKSAVYTKSRETVPQFKGGLNSFYKYLGHTIRYPAEAREKNIQGRVIVKFIVGEDGKISNAFVSKSVSPSLDAEALRVIENSPPWNPATLLGKPVKVSFSVPIGFSLSYN